MIVIYRRQDVKEEEIEWIENPRSKKGMLIIYIGAGVGFCIIFALSIFFLRIGWGLLFGCIFISIGVILSCLADFLFHPQRVGFIKEGISFKYTQEKMRFIPWHEIYNIELRKGTKLFPSEEYGGGYIVLKDGKMPRMNIRYNVAREIKRRHGEYKRERGLL